MRRSNCTWARKQKWRYLDKTLPAPLSRRVEAHLAVCIPCRAEFTLAQDALDALATGKPLTPEQQRTLQPPTRRLSLSKVAAIAILALLVGAGIYLWRMQGDALLTRLSARGSNDALPTMPEPTVPTELNTLALPGTTEATPPAAPEQKPIEAAPKLVEFETSPKPPQATLPRRAQPAPRRVAPTKPNLQATSPAEGTVEVYDETGALIKREQMKVKR
ncbi:MAG: zf-HC2 domain-containing protein [Fimbriimonadales bacterium]